MKLWGGRFNQSSHELLEQYTESLSFDQRLWEFDINGSIAHVHGLEKAKILSSPESEQLVAALEQIREDFSNNTVSLDPKLEDIHMNIEMLLTQKCGELGKKLHTGRSRNDQVSTDLRLYCRAACDLLDSHLENLMKQLVIIADRHKQAIMPGFTHLQKAQPVLFSHYILAFYEMFNRDQARLLNAKTRINVMPLGSAALAGTAYPIDRLSMANELGFDSISQNSMDAVSDRDFACDIAYTCSMIMMHISRLCEDLILFSSAGFRWIEIGDEFTTGSSIMPQKKNPDIAELARGKTGRVYGNLMSLLTLLKGLPLTYNRDLQEDKEALFDTLDTTTSTLRILTEMLASIHVNEEQMLAMANGDCILATDLADYLVEKRVPFRDAHCFTGKIVAYALQHGKDLVDLTLDEMKALCPAIETDVMTYLTLEHSLNRRNVMGGTAPNQVEYQLEKAKKGEKK